MMTGSLCAAAEAQAPKTVKYSTASWSVRDGHPISQSWTIVQDATGYLWMASPDGLVRFDGIEFSRWKPRGEPPLPDAAIFTLCAARDGSLWAGFGDGRVTRIMNGRVVNYRPGGDLPGGDVIALFESRDGTIWSGTNNGLWRFQANQWDRLGPSFGLPERPVRIQRLFEDREGTLWVASSAGIFRRIAGSARFELVSPELTAVRDFTQDPMGNIWITDRKLGLKRLGRAEAEERVLGMAATGYALLRDRNNHLWVPTAGQGLFRLRWNERNPVPVVDRFTERDGLTGNVVWSVLEDHEGNIWAGTPGALTRFTEERGHVSSPAELSDKIVTAVAMDKAGSIWAATTAGLSRFSGNMPHTYAEKDGLPSGTITALHADQQGTLWVATEKGLAQFANGRFSRPLAGQYSELQAISAMTSDASGAIWFCHSHGGVYRLSHDALHAVAEAENRRGLSMLTDTRGRLWVGFASGELLSYDDGRFNLYSRAHGLDGGVITGISEGSGGQLWIRTRDGLSKFDGTTFHTITAKNGLPIAALGGGVIEDDSGYLWVGISDGLARFGKTEFDRVASTDSSVLDYRLYDASDGVPGSPVTMLRSSPPAARDGSGRLWFITGSGVAVIDPKHVQERPAPAVRIDDVIVNGRRFSPDDQLALPPGVSTLEIDYGALSLTYPEKVRFRYILEGVDSHWVDAGSRRAAYYTNLAPATYRFRVAANNDGGLWNESGASMELSIQPFVYQTRWFYFASATFGLIALCAIWQVRTRQIRQRYSVILAERERLAMELHVNLLQSLVGIGLQCDAIANTVEASPSSAKDQLGRIGELVDYYVHETQLSIRDLRSSTLENRDLGTALRLISTHITAGSNAVVELNIAGAPVRCEYRIESNLLHIAQEAIANAIRHANAARIRVELSYSDEAVTLRVSDDGCGFDPTATMGIGDHWGLLSMRERAQQIRGRYTLVSQPGQGTQIETVVMLSGAHA
jgi:ligand-binding sensor domain-containing protein/signal transduction histidine kinase